MWVLFALTVKKNSPHLKKFSTTAGGGGGDLYEVWFRGWLDIFRSERAVLTISHHILCPMGPVKEKKLQYVPFKGKSEHFIWQNL